MKKKFAVIFMSLILCAGIAAGCGAAPSEPEENSSAVESKVETPSSSVPEKTESEPEKPVSDGGLAELRKEIKNADALFGAAFYGYSSSMESSAAADLLNIACPSAASEYPFAANIPAERVIANADGELYCIVPKDENTTVSVNRLMEGADGTLEISEVLYKSENGEPFLLLCNTAFSPDTEVVIVDGEGNSVSWYPYVDDNLFMSEGTDEMGDYLLSYDFSPYNAMLKEEYEAYQKGFWVKPEQADLVGTSWSVTEYYGEVEKTYDMTFDTNTVQIQWFDGGENHEYNAEWSLEEKGDVVMLRVDLGNMDGIRYFPVLITTEGNLIYTSADFTSGTTPVRYEKMNRTLECTYG